MLWKPHKFVALLKVFTDAEPRTLGALAKKVSIRALRELDPIVSPTRLLCRHRVANASVEWLAPKNAWSVLYGMTLSTSS